MKNFDTILCNPPYNGGDNESPIYHLFLEKFHTSKNSIWVIPSSWLGNPDWSIGNKIRKLFHKAGLFYVCKNQNDVFVTANVRTSCGVCVRGYRGDVIWENREDKKSLLLSENDLLKKKILFSFDKEEIAFLDRMKEYSQGPFSWFDGKPNTWKIGVFHINRNKLKNQLGDIRLMDPKEFDAKHSNKYIKLWEGESEQEVREILPKIESYWNSRLLQYLLYKVWHTYTIQRSMFSDLPSRDDSRVWNDEDLFERYELTDEEKKWVL